MVIHVQQNSQRYSQTEGNFSSVWLYRWLLLFVLSLWSRLCGIRLTKFVIIALHYIQVHRNQYQVPTESPCDFVHCNYVPIVYRFPSYNDGRTRKLVFLSPFYPPQSRLKPSSRLQLNNDKTEFTGCGTVGRLHRLPITGSTIGSFTMTPPLKVRDLENGCVRK